MKKLILFVCLFLLLPGAGKSESAQLLSEDGRWLITSCSFAAEMPKSLSELLAEQGYEGWHCRAGAMLERAKAADSSAGKRTSALLVLEKNGLCSLMGLSAFATGESSLWDYGTLGLMLSEAVGMKVEGAEEESHFVLETVDGTFHFREESGSDWSLAKWRTNDGFEAEWYPRGQIVANGQSFPVWETPYLSHVASLSELPMSLPELQSFSETSMQALEDTGLAMLAGVNLRSRPTAESEWLGSAHAGTLVQVLDTRKGRTDHWYQIQIGDFICWASGPYVKLPGNRQISHLPLPSAVTIRKSQLWDSSCHNSLMHLSEGTEVQILAEMKEGWMIVSVPEDGTAGWRMETAGRIGWMKREDLEVSW